MNLYDSVLQVSNCIKARKEIQELIDKYNKIKLLKNDIKYSFFFSLIEGKEFYHFFAPNISMQIISNIYKNNDFEIMPKQSCELITNNEDIKQYVQISTQVSEIVTHEIVSFFSPQEFKGDIKTVYAYNKLSEKLGYIGFIENLKIMIRKGKKLELYFKERNKIVEEGSKMFPIHKFDDKFLKEVYALNFSQETVDSIEKFNLILFIIEKIIYCNIYDKILYIKNENITIINKNEKANMIYQEMKIDENNLIFKHFPILVLENNYYFPYSQEIKFAKGETIIKRRAEGYP